MTLAWFALAACYLGFIFWLGSWGDGRSQKAKYFSSHPFTYAFALAIYCTAWTYFGAVGEAARNHWNYLPILLGPMLLYLFGYRLIIKLIQVSKKQHITTIADLVSSRYGKRQIIALVVTLIVLLATIPYIALQLQAIGAAFASVSGAQNTDLVVLAASVFIGAFCVFFGTRRTDVTEYRHGLMLSIAFESMLKLFALALVAIVAWVFLLDNRIETGSHFLNIENVNDSIGSIPFWLQTFVAGAAVLCLPRQFHVAIIDNLNVKHVHTARWLFPLYLLIIALLIPVITSVGLNQFSGTDIHPDNYVLALSESSNSLLLQALVFLGGLSAATAMIIVSTLTLSTMISNDVILPKLLSGSKKFASNNSHINQILWLRRGVIAAILLLGYGYHIYLSNNMTLASIGLLAFSLVIQLLPAIVAGLYWQRAHAHGVIAGLISGIFAWVLFLLFPIITHPASEPLSGELISITAVLALAVNCIFFVIFSRLSTPSLIDKIQAHAFVKAQDAVPDGMVIASTSIKNEDLITVLDTFLGPERTRQLVSEYEYYHKVKIPSQQTPDQDFILFCERSLGGVIGASSSNLLINAVLHNQQMNFEQLVRVFDDTTQAIQTNQTMLFASLESLAQGLSVVDKSLCLVAWNKGYLDVFNYPEGMVSVGTPVETLVRYNAERGECGPGDIDMLVNKRMEHLRAGKPHKFVRRRSDGRVIEMIGNPLPNGGFVTSFNDVTEHIEIQRALKEANIDLEKRVSSRTDEVKAINEELHTEIQRRAEIEQQLVEAREIAEQANSSKTRFLALASHDILQPLNSAKLYLSAMHDQTMSEEASTILKKLENSVNASETLISTLLEIARLDQGALKPNMQACSLRNMFTQLQAEFESLAQAKNLRFRLAGNLDHWVLSDPIYLQRIMRNLLSNAVKYTENGEVMLAIRGRREQILIQIYDTGEGITDTAKNKIFEDFYRAHEGNEQGVGLGLAVVARLSKLLDINLSLRSHFGKGSCFSLSLPIAEAEIKEAEHKEKAQEVTGLSALCLDDDPQNLDAMQTLLTKWNITATITQTPEQAFSELANHKPDVLLVDYHLGKAQDGLMFIQQAREKYQVAFPAILITAVREQEIINKAKALDIGYLSKPVKPAKLRALLRAYKVSQSYTQSTSRYSNSAGE